MLAGKKFSTNEEVITETEAYFEVTIKMVSKNCMIAIIVVSPSKRTILNNKFEFYFSAQLLTKFTQNLCDLIKRKTHETLLILT
jgi:uncharacterized protein YlzI (FlbEa/FlbD family)